MSNTLRPLRLSPFLTYHIASWLATQGVSTYTFDYRYTGLSFPPPYNAQSFTEEGRHAAMRTCPEDVTLTMVWAKKDFAAVVRFASDENPGVPLTIVSNSLGGRKSIHFFVVSIWLTPGIIDLMTLFPEAWPRITRFLSVCGGQYPHQRTSSLTHTADISEQEMLIGGT